MARKDGQRTKGPQVGDLVERRNKGRGGWKKFITKIDEQTIAVNHSDKVHRMKVLILEDGEWIFDMALSTDDYTLFHVDVKESNYPR
jgi:hypothetical protein